jgi:hypothetical protein
MTKKPVYIKCPRCELNYIDKKLKLCNICKAELSMPNSFYSAGDDTDDNPMELCPVCKSNYISLDEEVCEKCKGKENPLEETPSEEEDENWRSFLDDEAEDVAITTEDGVEISLSKLEEEELEKDFADEEEDFEEEEEEEEFKDDFDEDEFEPYDENEDYGDDDEDDDED